MKYGKNKQVLSVGRVQTPTLALIVRRHFEIKNFVPKVYYELKTIYRDTTFSSNQGKFANKSEGEAILKAISGEVLTIKNTAVKKGKEHPPNLFDLTSLQVEANNKLGWSADHTLKVIQNLYEKKLVTYPRVDTVFLPNDQYSKIKTIFNGLKNYYPLLEPLKGKAIKKSKKVFNDSKVTDHHAIIPTGVPATSIAGDELLLYDIITLRFIAAFYPECEVSNSTVEAQVAKYDFKATGRQILNPGWRAVYQSDKGESSGRDKNALPIFQKGESGPHEPDFAEKFTNPPKEYTEATLLRAMETAGKTVDDDELQQLMKENGIGRPSTRANIIETLFKRKYIEKNKKKILPTETGIQLIQLIENPTLKSAELTGRWEKKLREIEDQKYTASHFIDEMKTLVKDLVEEVQMDQGQEKLRCPKCEVGKMVKGKSAYGCTEWKNGCDFTVPFQLEALKMSDRLLPLLIRDKKLKFDNQQTWIIDDWFTSIIVKPLSCPKCSKGVLLKGKSAFGCSNHQHGCSFTISFEIVPADADRKLLVKAISEKHSEQF